MLNFKCSNCQNDIQVAEQYMGDMVQCPFCTSLQIVPDPMLPEGTNYNGYIIVKTIASSILWTTYEISQQPHNLALCVPTSFFLKRVSDISSFAEHVKYASSLNRPEIPALVHESLENDNMYFVFEYQLDAYKLNSFISEKPLDFYSALFVVRNIANCLSQIWEKEGILHQCIIPENICINNQLNVRIKNLGLSDYLLKDQPLLELGFNIWDYKYISPEFMNQGEANSPACDIYSLGGILFFLCTGHHPHENTPPDSIPTAPVPILTQYLQEAPESLLILVQMMMAPNIESRLTSWHEVIKHIDTILANLSALTNQSYYFNTQPNQTNYYEPVGLSAGDMTQNISRDKVADKPKKNAPHKTLKPIAKQNLLTMNKKWNSKQSKKNSHKNDHKPIQTPKKDATKATIITLSIATVAALIIVIVILISANKKTIPKRKRIVAKTVELDANSKQRELLLKQGIDLSKLNPNANKTTPDIPEGNAAASSLKTPMDKKIDAIVSAIKKQILPLLKAGKYDEALAILLEYEGELAPESQRKRMDVAEEIKARVAKIEAGEPVGNTAPSQPQAPVSSNPIKILKKIAKQFAPSLFKGDASAAKVQLEMALTTANDGIIKNNLNTWLSQINNYIKLKPELANSDNADTIIKALGNETIMAKAYLLQGMLYKDKEQFVQAKQSFMKLPYYLGDVFVDAMEKSMNE